MHLFDDRVLCVSPPSSRLPRPRPQSFYLVFPRVIFILLLQQLLPLSSLHGAVDGAAATAAAATAAAALSEKVSAF